MLYRSRRRRSGGPRRRIAAGGGRGGGTRESECARGAADASWAQLGSASLAQLEGDQSTWRSVHANAGDSVGSRRQPRAEGMALFGSGAGEPEPRCRAGEVTWASGDRVPSRCAWRGTYRQGRAREDERLEPPRLPPRLTPGSISSCFNDSRTQLCTSLNSMVWEYELHSASGREV